MDRICFMVYTTAWIVNGFIPYGQIYRQYRDSSKCLAVLWMQMCTLILCCIPIGCRWSGQDQAPMEALLHRHTGFNIRGGLCRQRSD